MKTCKICERKISQGSKLGYCHSCATREYIRQNPSKHKGKNNPNHKQGKFCNNKRCKDCNKKIGYSSIRCRKCADKQHGLKMSINNTGENNSNFKHGLSKNRKQYTKYRRETDINFKIRQCLGSRISNALKRNVKSAHTIELIGCSIEYLKYYLQLQFTKGMTWKNYGNGNHGKSNIEWQIDHIRPCCAFDLSKKSEQLKCFNYTNLQPLWAIDNRHKISRDHQFKRKIT